MWRAANQYVKSRHAGVQAAVPEFVLGRVGTPMAVRPQLSNRLLD